MSLLDLPTELLGGIASLLSLQEAARLAQTCRQLRRVRAELLRNCRPLSAAAALAAQQPLQPCEAEVVGDTEWLYEPLMPLIRMRCAPYADAQALRWALERTGVDRTRMLAWALAADFPAMSWELLLGGSGPAVHAQHASRLLVAACWGGRLDAVRLVANTLGAGPAEERVPDAVVLAEACYGGSVPVLRFLVNELGLRLPGGGRSRGVGAVVGVGMEEEISQRHSILCAACKYGHVGLVAFLFEELGFTLHDLRVSFGVCDIVANTAAAGHTAVLHYLMHEVGYGQTLDDAGDNTVVGEALRTATANGNKAVADVLVSAVSGRDWQDNEEDEWGWLAEEDEQRRLEFGDSHSDFADDDDDQGF